MKDAFQELRKRAVEALVSEGILRSPKVIRAMLKVPREEFVSQDIKERAYIDMPLPIGCGQTTSAMHMTAMFCEYGELELGKKVLEIGGGCGYMSCVYAEIVASSGYPEERWGHVWSVEIIKDLTDTARDNIKRAGYDNRVSVIHGDGSLGLTAHKPYDVIIVTSAAPNIPNPLIEQLKIDGILLIPVGDISLYQQLIMVRKNSEKDISKEVLTGVAFVPMRGKYGWSV
jgi:protein-L-isoaspartate(D-aspartate) O-methyltransferase